MAKIRDIAQACKSKNAGPFAVTLDIVFHDAETFEKARASGVLNAGLIAQLYNVAEKDVLFSEFPPCNAFKATIPRKISAGGPGDMDVFGAQQHAPLLDVDIPL